MALNSLYPDGWFALGAAALKVITTFYCMSNLSLAPLYALYISSGKMLRAFVYKFAFFLVYFLILFFYTG